MNWELLLYLAAGLALIAAVLFIAAFGYVVLHAVSTMREARREVRVHNWPDPDIKRKLDQQRANKWTRR